ncbi:aggregation-promoting factor [Fructilactobacillus sanfranciscensis]|uniref:aggregation-promoting factor n=1 Tax=Fructilactobacillus sanfranciscensis TaxID=1625 RepID=UPI00111B10C4|nr:LysM domain-containing protein [Fructilactobacillus sanfranciscensis]MVF15788.1 LysM peptidoglycan-binding domain-containing protein [Fructilactobacillus sanfranciscensis]NDR60506.1 LysM peptidoglycan-binding domain-containing protein [Fructilactobacillus sanfranciscensis]TNK95601.1 peptidase M23 [Fructilactobacillus sanfranciscensis]WED57347.1 LysM domain-containing protein [Fructilactobacillus sanfranciscensis]
MKFKGLKTIAAVTAVSAGVLFAGANSANASTRVTVKSGDTISELAKTYNISMQSIKDANNIQDINKIYVGEVFDIDNGDVQVVAPATTDTPAAATPSVTAPVQQATAPAAQAPAQPAAPVQQATAPAAQAPAQPAAPVQQAAAPATSSVSGSDAAAKDWIAGRESGGNYGAQNGQFVGKYQLSASYLNGDYSAANQERVADNYVTSRYGSWSGAQSFWQSHGWY